MLNNKSLFNNTAQIALPVLTIGGQLAISLKYPKFGLTIILLAQPFWLYSSWKAFREAGQIGILITSITLTIITVFGVINYWLL